MADTKLGLVLLGADAGFSPADAELVTEAEALGYSSFWVPEVTGPDAFVRMAFYAQHTRNLTLGTGVLPIQIRTPVVMANGFLSLSELSGGRIVAGLGVSSPVIVERWHGAAYRKPLTAMRECITIMRQIFNDGRAKFDGQVYRADIRLGLRPTQPRPRIVVAALNPPMLRLAGELADGVLLNYSPVDAMKERIAAVRQAATAAGRDSAAVEIGLYARMCATDDDAGAVRSFKRELATYAFVDAYDQMFAHYGLGEEMAEVRRLWKEGQREQAPDAIRDSSARRLGTFGPRAVCRQVIAEFRAAGVDHPVVAPVGPRGVDDVIDTMHALAGA